MPSARGSFAAGFPIAYGSRFEANFFVGVSVPVMNAYRRVPPIELVSPLRPCARGIFAIPAGSGSRNSFDKTRLIFGEVIRTAREVFLCAAGVL